jgi:hypothetical protein
MVFKSDFTTSTPGKVHSRLATLSLVRDHSSFIWSRKHNTLRLDWVETSGTHAPSFQLLLDEAALTSGNGKFIGVDTEADVISGCESHFASAKDFSEWKHGNLITLLRDRAASERVGIVVYDSFDAAHGRKMMSNVRFLLDFAVEQFERLPEFLLVLNVVVQRTSDLTAYKDLLREYVPDADLSEEGGAFFQYEGRKGTKMLLTRVRFGF